MNLWSHKTFISILVITGAFLLSLVWVWIPNKTVQGAQETIGLAIAGSLIDEQNESVAGAEVTLTVAGDEEPLAETESQEDGTWALIIEDLPFGTLFVDINRPHFQSQSIRLEDEDRMILEETGTLGLGEITLQRRVSAGFWAATIIFVAVLILIAFEVLHSTTAALAGISAVFIVTFLSFITTPDLYIFNFEQALEFINWEVIFLVMGMMIIVAIIEGTGIFQWTAFQAYRISGGRSWLLVLILMAITAFASALLDNFTTMLLMTPISLQIALAIGINPLALIIPEVLASNVGGISTLIGTPTNILIGAFAGIGFTDFLRNQTVGVIAALIVMSLYILFHYRKEWRKGESGISETLYDMLKENARIREPTALWKSGLIFLFVIVGFIVGEQFHFVPAIPALIGATALLIWLKPDIHAMIKAVDWTTLVFFMALFMLVGAVQEVGLMALIATVMGQIIGENLVLGIFLMVFGVGTLSIFIANIPLAASMLPVVNFLTGTVPGAASTNALYYALSMGVAMGGNGLLISAEANLVTGGITEQAGFGVSFKEFLKIGLPVTYLTLGIGFLWLLLRFIV